jgi:hypothetical protein
MVRSGIYEDVMKSSANTKAQRAVTAMSRMPHLRDFPFQQQDTAPAIKMKNRINSYTAHRSMVIALKLRSLDDNSPAHSVMSSSSGSLSHL